MPRPETIQKTPYPENISMPARSAGLQTALLVAEDPMPPYPSAPPALDRDSPILIAVIDHAIQIIFTVASGTRIRIQDLPFTVGYPGTKFSRI